MEKADVGSVRNWSSGMGAGGGAGMGGMMGGGRGGDGHGGRAGSGQGGGAGAKRESMAFTNDLHTIMANLPSLSRD